MVFLVFLTLIVFIFVNLIVIISRSCYRFIFMFIEFHVPINRCKIFGGISVGDIIDAC